MSTARYLIGDVFDVLATLEPASVDMVMTSPPFLALRSYLPADHPDKAKEIGSEATPADFLDTLLDVVEACDRVLAPHGSIVVELGDTYSGSGGAGGDYMGEGLRNGQPRWDGSASRTRSDGNGKVRRGDARQPDKTGSGWPLDKSLCGIPTLFAWSLAYGRNLLRPERTTPQWRIRNVVAWCRPNPPVGALGDKVRPATSYLTIATKARDRYFDLDAVRQPHKDHADALRERRNVKGSSRADGWGRPDVEMKVRSNVAGAPPLDYWVIPTQPYSGVWQGDTLYRASRDCPEHSLRAIRQRLQTGSSGELREALARNSRRTDLDPAVKRACELHAKSDLDDMKYRLSMTDWLDQTIRSERTTESTAASRTPAPPGRSDRGHGRQGADARTAARTSSTPTASMLTDQTTATSPLGYSPSATPHGTGSNRTDHAPVTNPAGMPSAQTASRTGGTSTSPGSSGTGHGTDVSNISEPGSDDPSARTTRRIAGKPGRCSCEQFTESASHYATYPEKLCEIPIKSMCPLRVCTVCGQPSRRIVSDPEYDRLDSERVPARLTKLDGQRPAEGVNQHTRPDGANTSVVRRTETLGWTDCGHNAWRTGVVLDPFAGSGTTLAVATGHGRDAIGIDLDHRNADLALDRVGPLMLTIEHPTLDGVA